MRIYSSSPIEDEDEADASSPIEIYAFKLL